jgi:16S rRNA (guanine527-N7)-methyltransferase
VKRTSEKVMTRKRTRTNRNSAKRKVSGSQKRERQPDPQFMDDLLQMGGIYLQPQQLSLLWRFHNLLRKRNLDRDLTRITGFESMVIKHYVDCMVVAQRTKLPNYLLDIGTGPGFPAIPLKILQPETQWVLAEHRPKRVQFLKDVCRELKLEDMGIFAHKVTLENFTLPVNGVITRALEEIPKTLKRSSGFLSKGGLVFFMKGPAVDQELKEMKNQVKLLEQYELTHDFSYELPKIRHQRRLVVYRKIM